MKPKIALSALLFLLAVGLSLVLFCNRKVTIQINDQETTLSTRALTVSEALRQAGIVPESGDQIQPDPNSWLVFGGRIVIQPAVHYQILTDGQSLSCITPERSPGKVISSLNLPLHPADQVSADGIPVNPALDLPFARHRTLEIRRAVQITLQTGDRQQVFQSAAPTLGEALWEQGIFLTSLDRLTPPADTPLSAPVQAILKQPYPVTLLEKETAVPVTVPDETIGQALAQAGVSLQNGDSTLPPETDPIPENREIKIVRAAEQLNIQESYLPFFSKSELNDSLPLDQKEIIQNGEVGILLSQERIFYRDSVETKRLTLTDQVVKNPVDEIVGYGTKINLQTIDTPEGSLEVYRAVQVYATAYSPCHSGTSNCSNSTASGMPIQRGVIAVIPQWYAYMAGERVYIPGYGTAVIGDTGGGIPGTPWIDLAFSDEEYTSWHSWVTLYFLAPPPAQILYDLH